MGRKLVFFLVLTSVLIGLGEADHWNILNSIKKTRNVIGVKTSLKNYCESWRINVELNNIRGFEYVPQECTHYTWKYMTSTQYKSDSERAIKEAQLYSSNHCNLKGDGKDAWIFDVDGTLISTLPFIKKHSFGYVQFLFYFI